MLFKTELMSREQFWRRSYQNRPYLVSATDERLADRLRYIVENFTTLTPSGQVGFLSPEPFGKYWMEMAAHVLEAYKARNGHPPPMFLKDAMVPKPTYPNVPPAVRALKDVTLPAQGTYLVKLGRYDHIRDLYEHGRIRIGAARGYSDSSLNAAVRDNELRLVRYALQSEIKMETFDKVTGQSRRIEPIGDVTHTMESTTDFYVYCMSQTLDIRLFSAFEYDACVIFHNPDEFIKRMFHAVQSELLGWIPLGTPVEYYDPYCCKPSDVTPLTSKHHRFWYQHEYRLGWLPPTDALVDALNPIFVELGSLKDVSQFIRLENT
jgi:hypothetical protein